MNVPAMYIVGLVFDIIFTVMLIIAYFYLYRKTGNRFVFPILFAAAWFVSIFSYVFLIAGAPADAWYITLIRIINYILFLGTIVSLMVELRNLKKP